MGNLKHYMASKYPKKVEQSPQSTDQSTEPGSEISETVEESIEDDCFFNRRRKKCLKLAIFLGILFFILSSPFVYGFMGNILNNFPGMKYTVSEDISNRLNWKIVMVHSIFFSILSYILLEFSLKN